MMELTLTVGAERAAVRLDAFLHGALRGSSRRVVRRLIAAGEVRVNGRPARKGTSGLLVAARTTEAHARLRAALRARQVEKGYLAVVHGDALGLDGIRVRLPLAHDPHDRRRMVPAASGLRSWPAETAFAVRVARSDRSLVEATIRTGVTHQVRVHLAQAGHPVLGDLLYGGAPAGLAPGRHALHAAGMTFAHPVDGRPLALGAPLPADLVAFGA